MSVSTSDVDILTENYSAAIVRNMPYPHRPEAARAGKTTHRIEFKDFWKKRSIDLAVGDRITTRGTWSDAYSVKGTIEKITYDADTCNGDRPAVGYELVVRGESAYEKGRHEIPVCQLQDITRVK